MPPPLHTRVSEKEVGQFHQCCNGYLGRLAAKCLVMSGVRLCRQTRFIIETSGLQRRQYFDTILKLLADQLAKAPGHKH